MKEQPWSKLFSAVFLGVLAAIAGWLLLVKLYPLLLMILAGFAVAYLFNPLLNRLEQRGWSRPQAVWGLLVVVLAFLAVALLILVPIMINQAQGVAHNWPQYSEHIQQLATPYRQRLETALDRFFPEGQAAAYFEQQRTEIEQWLSQNLAGVFTWVSTRLLHSFAAVGLLALVFVIAFWFMIVINPFRRRLQALFSSDEAAQLRLLDRQVSQMLGQYLRGMAITCLAIAVTNSLLLTIMGLVFGTEYAVILGVMSGVAYLVPWLGMFVTEIAIGVLAYLTADHHALLAVVVMVGAVMIVNQSYDSYVMPKIVGRKVGLHPLVIILALLAGGMLFGLWGMILATPVAATIKIILSQWLPLTAPIPDQPPSRQPLALDLGKSLEGAWHFLSRIRSRGSETGAAPPRATTAIDEEVSDDDAAT